VKLSSTTRPLGALAILMIWMANLLVPTTAERLEDWSNLTEYEHSESEPEGEEGSVEWEETPILSLVKATDFPEVWHMLRRMNMQWHERLIASRFLDPPDGSVAV